MVLGHLKLLVFHTQNSIVVSLFNTYQIAVCVRLSYILSIYKLFNSRIVPWMVQKLHTLE